jgi:hypothetical protein
MLTLVLWLTPWFVITMTDYFFIHGGRDVLLAAHDAVSRRRRSQSVSLRRRRSPSD